MRSEFFYPTVADRRSRAGREEGGKQDARTRAAARVERLLREHQAPDLPSEVDAAIRARFNILL